MKACAGVLVVALASCGGGELASGPAADVRNGASPVDARSLSYYVDPDVELRDEGDQGSRLRVSAGDVASDLRLELASGGVRVAPTREGADATVKVTVACRGQLHTSVAVVVERRGAIVAAKRDTHESLCGHVSADKAAHRAMALLTELARDPKVELAEPSEPSAVAVAPPSPVTRALPPTPDPLAAPVTKMSQPDAYAVIVGIEKYRGGFPDATGAERDARAFRDVAVRTLGVPEGHIKLLLGANAGKADLESVLEEWLPNQPRRAPSNTYFFFSGHGAPDPRTGDGYVVPYDGDPEYLRTKAISLKHVYDVLGALPSSRTVAFVDSCFSGSGGRSILAAGLRPLVPAKAAAPATGAVVAFTAAASSQVSGTTEGGGHGLFTYHLLRGLSGLADRDGDHVVTLVELETFVGRQVAEDARRENREQTPQLLTSGIAQPGGLPIVEGLVP